MSFEVIERKKQFAVLGLGIFGMEVAESLSREGAEVVVADKSEKLVSTIKGPNVFPYVLDTTDEDALSQVGIDTVDCAIVCIGVDMTASILTTLLMKKFKIPQIIARAYTPEHAQILSLLGIDEVIQPELSVSQKLARRLVGKSGFLLSYDEMWKDHAIVEVRIDSRLAGKTLIDLNFRYAYKVNIVAIKRVSERLGEGYKNVLDFEINEVPDPREPLMEGDILIILGTRQRIQTLSDALLRKKA